MEKFAVLAIPLLLLCFLIRLIMLPVKAAWKIVFNAGCGFLCLWLLNSVASFTGIYFPVNTVTAVIAGLLGLPGIAVLAVIQLFL